MRAIARLQCMCIVAWQGARGCTHALLVLTRMLMLATADNGEECPSCLCITDVVPWPDSTASTLPRPRPRHLRSAPCPEDAFMHVQVRKITTRVNTVNGRVYSKDPTIFSWCAASTFKCIVPCAKPWPRTHALMHSVAGREAWLRPKW